MARGTSTVVENNFSKGLITEVSPLSFPENACVESLNLVHHISGTVTRRLGFEYEPNYSINTVTRDDGMISEYTWKAPGGDGSLTFLVTQYGHILRFYQLDTAGKLSNVKAFTVNLNTFLPAGSTFNAKNYRCQYTAGNGYLFVSNPVINTFYIKYDVVGDTITTYSIVMRIRDFEGVDDGLAVDTRPATLSEAHKYNLHNQGWHLPIVLVNYSGNVTSAPITRFNSVMSAYPSNSDIWWIYKRSTGDMFLEETGYSIGLGNTPAPKGHFIVNPFNQDRNVLPPTFTGLTSLDSKFRRPRTVAFAAGRVFYAGVDYQGYNSNVYFSQVIEEDDQIGFCYQTNDPTDENISDLLPTDGGVIKITDATNIIKILPLGASIYIFASNGIWSISGSSGLGFTANDYSIQKISTVSVLSETSFVDIGSSVLWWNSDGIYGLELNEAGVAQVKSLTETTIKSFYSKISTQAIMNAKGAFNPLTGVIQWLYKNSTETDVDIRQDYNSCLNLNIQSGAFYSWTINGSVRLNGITAIENPTATALGSTKFYYLVTTPNAATTWNFTIALNEDTINRDWTIYNGGTGIGYNSRLVSGYKLYGDGNKDFQSNYITVYLRNVSEDSSVFIQGMWDFSNTDDEFRWSLPQQCYLFHSLGNTIVVSRKIKIRGRGKALQFRFYADNNAPFELLGWSVLVSGNSNV